MAEIPAAMHAALIDPYSGGAWLWLVEIAVTGYDTIKYARNTKNISYAGSVYLKNNFNIGLSSLSGDGSIPRITLQIVQDANHTLEDIINETQGAYGGTVKIIRAHEDFLSTSITSLEQTVDILTAQSDTDEVVFILGISNPLLKKIPLRRTSSKTCPYALPSLFKGPECGYAGGDGICTGKFEDCYTKSNAARWGGEIGLDPNTARI